MNQGRRTDIHPIMLRIEDRMASLTRKGKIIAAYVLKNPSKVVFMTTRELAAACDVSEATVVRLVGHLGYRGYSDMQQSIRDAIDTELTLLDRVDISDTKAKGNGGFRQAVFDEIENLKLLLKTISLEDVEQAVELLHRAPSIYVVGSRLSYTLSYFMGWSLMKVRARIHIVKGSDSTTIDRLSMAGADSLVVMVATARYPNELLRIGRLVRRLGQRLIVITDSVLCPLTQFAHLSLIAPQKSIPVIGNPNAMTCLINYIVLELAGRSEGRKAHQRRLEQTYRENDILFNPHGPVGQPVDHLAAVPGIGPAERD